jgi:hypothetical protein
MQQLMGREGREINSTAGEGEGEISPLSCWLEMNVIVCRKLNLLKRARGRLIC